MKTPIVVTHTNELYNSQIVQYYEFSISDLKNTETN